MTINACIDEQRKRRRFFSLDGLFGEIRSKKNPDAAIRQREMSEEVRAAIGELREHYRVPLMLKYLEDLSYEEIAAVLECSVGTVSSRLNRGHKKLAARLAHLKDLI
jgi:RNA polymerase sigma-70 factor (ECF subfamily)